MEQNHQLLINECKRNSEKAQLQLYKLFYKGVYSSCFRILKRQDEAEDALQDTFIKAFRKIELLNPNISLEAWLRRIAINTSIDILRKKKDVLVELNEEVERIEEDEPEDFNETLLKVAAIKEAIDSLPQGFRLVLTLYLIEDYSYDEIAEMLRISASTVRSQYVRGKARLLEIVKVQQ